MRDAILIARDGKEYRITLDVPVDTLGVIVQQDTRLTPQVRTFRYRPADRVSTVPVFAEVDHAFLSEKDHIG